MRPQTLNNEISSQSDGIKKRWPKLSAADITRAGNDLKGLSSVVAERYGLDADRAKAEVEEFTSSLGTSIGEAVHAVGEAASDLFHDGKQTAVAAARKTGEKATELWHAGEEQAKKIGGDIESWMKERPMASLAIAAGAGAVLSLILFPRGRH